jgi:hypothetical protein
VAAPEDEVTWVPVDEDPAFEILVEGTAEAVAVNVETIPEGEKPAAEAERPAEQGAPGPGGPGHDDGNPIQARLSKGQKEHEVSDRARLWAEMRYRERQGQMAQAKAERAERQKERRQRLPRRFSRRLILMAAAAVLLLIGGGVGAYYYLTADAALTAADAWAEFDRDNKAANLKYKGKVVRVTGKVKIVPVGDAKRLYFEGPEDAKWKIEFSLRNDQINDVKSGQEATVRGRFSQRKDPDSDLTMTNCRLLKTD